jgi:hypothetical protein
MVENNYILQSFRRLYGDRWNKMTEEERRQAMSDPFTQGRMEGERSKEVMRRAAEHGRGFRVGAFGPHAGR